MFRSSVCSNFQLASLVSRIEHAHDFTTVSNSSSVNNWTVNLSHMPPTWRCRSYCPILRILLVTGTRDLQRNSNHTIVYKRQVNLKRLLINMLECQNVWVARHMACYYLKPWLSLWWHLCVLRAHAPSFWNKCIIGRSASTNIWSPKLFEGIW
jgi:hypothetical protein